MQIFGSHHIAMFTARFAEMEAFYTQTLGFPVTKRWDDAGIIFIDIGGTKIELIGKDHLKGSAQPHALGEGTGLNHLAFHVADVDQAFKAWKERGARVLSEPRDFQDVRIAFFADPDGNPLELVEERPG